MKIATFNANSIRARLEIVLDWLRESRPDVLCVQETKVEDKDFPAAAFTHAGYHVTFKGQKSYNGVAVISRQKPTAVLAGLDDGGQPDETRILYARFGAVHVVNTYVPQGREINHAMYRYKLRWFKRLRAYFDRHFSARMKLLWAGDLNVAPQAIDVHNADRQAQHVCYHTAVRRAFAEACDWGFVDVFRKHHPEPGQYTYFDYRAKDAVQQKRGWRVDHVLASSPLAKRSAGCTIDLKPRLLPRPSDHTFLTAEFDL